MGQSHTDDEAGKGDHDPHHQANDGTDQRRFGYVSDRGADVSGDRETFGCLGGAHGIGDGFEGGDNGDGGHYGGDAGVDHQPRVGMHKSDHNPGHHGHRGQDDGRGDQDGPHRRAIARLAIQFVDHRAQPRFDIPQEFLGLPQNPLADGLEEHLPGGQELAQAHHGVGSHIFYPLDVGVLV